MKLAVFDFDGTITKNNTFLEFTRFVVGDTKYLLGLIILSPILILYKLKLIPNYQAKQKMFSFFFKGLKEETLKKEAESYSLNHIEKILRPKAIKRIQWHKKHGHKIIIVSASLDCWIGPWCKKYGIEIIATQPEIKCGVVTGYFYTKNCYGIEKVNRIKELYNLDDFEFIYGYGDSEGDKEMLTIASKSLYKPFR